MRNYQILGYWNKSSDGKVYLNYIAFDIEFRYSFPIKVISYDLKQRERINSYLKYSVKTFKFDSILRYFNTLNANDLVSESYHDFINNH